MYMYVKNKFYLVIPKTEWVFCSLYRFISSVGLGAAGGGRLFTLEGSGLFVLLTSDFMNLA